MFSFDSLREIGATIRKNKLRTFLTGLSIVWGIFMLILLLGAGNGLKNGVTSNFSRRAKNSISIWSGETSMPYNGFAVGRAIHLDHKDFDLISKIPEVDHLSPSVFTGGSFSFGKNYGSWMLWGIYPDAGYINNIKVLPGKGRFINDIDISKKRKVIVINTEMEQVLFQGENPLGKHILNNGIAYSVIGVYKDETGRTNPPAYAPFSTVQSLYFTDTKYSRIDFTVKGLEDMQTNQAFMDKFKKKMATLHNYNPEDPSAIFIWNTAEYAVQTQTIFNSITFFIWIVGLASLMAGIVGVGNIMLITVKERTREFGIRKAIGATPFSILKSVLLEAVLITAIFGYIGMVLGIGLTEAVSSGMEMAQQASEGASNMSVFKDPTVNISTVLFATFVLVIAGVCAGYIPAKRAVKISPIEAMREGNE